MVALVKHTIPQDIVEEMFQLHRDGFWLIPLRGDGKKPAIKFGETQQIPLKRVLGIMARHGSFSYSIRLPGMVVVDIDENNPELLAQMEKRFGKSSVRVQTKRGIHLYFLNNGHKFPGNLKPEFPVDIKSGPNHFVVGPRSIRPDGVEYVPLGALLLRDNLLPALTPENLPKKAFIPTAVPQPSLIPDGQRHDALMKIAIDNVRDAASLIDLFKLLQTARDEKCENHFTMLDVEVLKIAAWAWQKRVEGNLYRGLESEFTTRRADLAAIERFPNASDAIALFMKLQSQHGHIPGKPFPLAYVAMKAAGHTDLSRERFRAARQNLQAAGVLEIASRHHAGNVPRTYRLCRKYHLGGSENVSPL